MLHVTPQERLALGVTALLLTAGVGARVLGGGEADVHWESARAADTSTGIRRQRARSDSAAAREQLRSRPLAAGERIDPNRASADELQRLPRVGPALAARLVQWREGHGGFRSLADVDSVQGVGPGLLAAIAPHLALPPAPPAPPPPPRPERTAAARGAADAGPVDVNAASAAELEALPGIGPALAARIVAWRRAHGPFHSAADLEKVPGIGPALRARLAPRIRTGG